MIEFYPEIRLAHILAVIASGSLFFLRGLAARAGRAHWALAPPVRHLSYAVDTALLTAALMLFTILPSAVFANGWLAAKLALRAYGLMFVVARTHDPLGALRLVTGG